MTLVRNAESRRTETPNGVMTTFATPTQGGTGGIAVWRVDMVPGKTGPRHAFDTEQVWTFLDGAATVDLDGRTLEARPGDTVVLPADAPRQMTAGDSGFTAVVAAHAAASPTTRTPSSTRRSARSRRRGRADRPAVGAVSR